MSTIPLSCSSRSGCFPGEREHPVADDLRCDAPFAHEAENENRQVEGLVVLEERSWSSSAHECPERYFINVFRRGSKRFGKERLRVEVKNWYASGHIF